MYTDTHTHTYILTYEKEGSMMSDYLLLVEDTVERRRGKRRKLRRMF